MTKTKKISMKDWEYIGKYNPAAKWLRPLCSYTLTETIIGFRRDCKIGWPMYLILFLPAHLIQLLYCLWDGGLKEFSIQGRHLGHDNITRSGDNCARYPQAREIWEKA
jgi:hypothetical protein